MIRTYTIICRECGQKENYENITWLNQIPICDSCVIRRLQNGQQIRKNDKIRIKG
jgi:hypothetical protein